MIKWNGTSAGKPIKKHTDAIWAIEKLGVDCFLTGGNDGKLIVWSDKFEAMKTLDIAQFVKYSPGVRSLAKHSSGDKLLIGTRGADVIELDIGESSNGEPTLSRTIV